VRPYIAQERAFDAYNDPMPAKVIGFEIRVRSAMGNQEEVQMIPLDIELPTHPHMHWTMPCTLHTSRGDVSVDIVLPF
jgi:hypothetical protein